MKKRNCYIKIPINNSLKRYSFGFSFYSYYVNRHKRKSCTRRKYISTGEFILVLKATTIMCSHTRDNFSMIHLHASLQLSKCYVSLAWDAVGTIHEIYIMVRCRTDIKIHRNPVSKMSDELISPKNCYCRTFSG